MRFFTTAAHQQTVQPTGEVRVNGSPEYEAQFVQREWAERYAVYTIGVAGAGATPSVTKFTME